MTRRAIQWARVVTLLIILPLSYALNLHAQDYRFSVSRVLMDVSIEPEGSALIQYDIHFNNDPSGHPIDFVDIGMPNEDYDFSSVEAYIDGERITSYGTSDYVKPGLAFELQSNQIPPGKYGRFQMTVRTWNLLFQDRTRSDYASFKITPTWFDSDFVRGKTLVTIRIRMPQGVAPDEVLYQEEQFTDKRIEDGVTIVEWQPEYKFTDDYMVGVSFPKRAVQRVITLTTGEMIQRWYQANSGWLQIPIIVLTFIVAGFAAIRLAGAAGVGYIFIMLFAYWSVKSFLGVIYPLILVGIVAVVIELLRLIKKPGYLPAIASVETGGIKRGLTAPEAAALLKIEPENLLTLVLFGLVKKKLIRRRENGEYVVESPEPENAVIHPYEKTMLGLMKRPSNWSDEKLYLLTEIDFAPVIKELGKSVAKKLEGHNVDETRNYYQSIVDRAWKEAKELSIPGTANRTFDEKLDWMMIDPNFEKKFRPYSSSYRPAWQTGSPSGSVSKGSPSSGAGPRIGDIAGSFAGWMESTAGSVSKSLSGTSMPLMNLESSGRGSGSGGSSGGGCACACAGCACACACAGGGR